MPYFQGATQIRGWASSPGPVTAGQALANGSYWVAPLDPDRDPMPGNIVANTFGVAMSVNHATGSTQAYTSTMRIGLYTKSGSTLSLVNSASATFGYGGATSTSATWTNLVQGARLLTVGTAGWSSSPIFLQGAKYWVGIVGLTNGFNGPASYMSAATVVSTAAMSGALGVAGASVSSQNEWAAFRGALSATTTGPPVTIANTALVASAGTGNFMPFFRIDDDFRNYA